MAIMPSRNSALVLFSGGQDSTTCLAWALNQFERVATIGFDYGQTHAVELQARHVVRDSMASLDDQWRSRLDEDYVFDASVVGAIGASSLTGVRLEQLRDANLPATFVPGRNLAFLVLAAAQAYRLGFRNLVTGVCETDFSGYPDCRDSTMKAMQVALNLGMDADFVIHTPLMWLDKAATWRLAEQIGGRPLLQVIQCDTHTCYQGTRETLHDWGYGCGDCAACRLRAEGWQTYAASSGRK